MVTTIKRVRIFGIWITYYKKSRPIVAPERHYSDLVDIWE